MDGIEQRNNGHHGHLRALVAASAEPAVVPGVDPVAAERAATDLLVALGADLGDESLRETPRRIAAMASELAS